MTINELERKLPRINALAQLSLSGVKDLMKEIFTSPHVDEDKMSDWQSILSQSKANGGFYHGEVLPQAKWEWPKNTWFQDRLSRRLKVLEIGAHHAGN